MCWPWLVLYLILLSSLPAQYTLTATQGSVEHTRFRLLPFSTFLFHHVWTIACPLLQQLDLGEYQGPGVNDCFFFLAKFWGISKVPSGLRPPPLRAFPQSKNVKQPHFQNCFCRIRPRRRRGSTCELRQKPIRSCRCSSHCFPPSPRCPSVEVCLCFPGF